MTGKKLARWIAGRKFYLSLVLHISMAIMEILSKIIDKQLSKIRELTEIEFVSGIPAPEVSQVEDTSQEDTWKHNQEIARVMAAVFGNKEPE